MKAQAPLVVIGDTLLDVDLQGRVERVCPDAPVPVFDQLEHSERPGGAGLAALLATQDPGSARPVVLVTALSDDAAGGRLRAALEQAEVEVVDVGLDGATPEKVRLRADGQSLLRIDRGAPPTAAVGRAPDELSGRLADAAAVLVSDYGRGMSRSPGVRAALERHVATTPTVWDPHPRGGAPVPGAWLVTPNAAEAERFAAPSQEGSLDGARRSRSPLARAAAAGEVLAESWAARAVAVTMGRHGALVITPGGAPLVAPVPRAADGDSCGAGDRFAAAAATALAGGALLTEAVQHGVLQASDYVAAGGAAALTRASSSLRREASLASSPPGAVKGAAHPQAWAGALRRAEEVRSGGGVVVVTGGCFDLLHAGHVQLLEQARQLGDCLVVALNSDASVRALKGPDRPIVTQDDRRRVLMGLACVDEVVVFDEPTPVAVLRALAPHIFAKGGDYAGSALPEQGVMAEWGGRVVVLPYLSGRSTTELLTSRRPTP